MANNRLRVKEGSVLICVDSGIRSLTMYGEYKAISVQSSMEQVEIIIRDDYDELRGITSADLTRGKFVIKGTEEHRKLKQYMSLNIGDEVECISRYRGMGKGEYGTVESLFNDGIAIQTIDGNDIGINNTHFVKHFEVSSLQDTKHIMDEDYSHMVDLALDTKDKTWFSELMGKVTGIITLG